MAGNGQTDPDGYPLVICHDCRTVYDMLTAPEGCPRCGCQQIETPAEFGGPNPMRILGELERGGDTGLRQTGFTTAADMAMALGIDWTPVNYTSVACGGCGNQTPALPESEQSDGSHLCIVCRRMKQQAFDEDGYDDIPF